MGSTSKVLEHFHIKIANVDNLLIGHTKYIAPK